MNKKPRTKRVIVIDDDPEMTSLLFDFLCGKGFHVTSFGSAAEAIEGLRQQLADPTQEPRAVDLIICDINMPGGLDGHRFTEEVHKLMPVPVILVTAFGGPAAAKRAVQAGASAFVTKPFSFSEMTSAITKVI